MVRCSLRRVGEGGMSGHQGGRARDPSEPLRCDGSPAMRTLLLGEALVDLICERPVVACDDADAFVPHFGGAVANVAVGAARAGRDGRARRRRRRRRRGARWLRDRLEPPRASASSGSRCCRGVLTPVAFVTVDERGEPSYAIYGDTIEAVIEALEGRLDEAVDALRRALPHLEHARRRARARADARRPRARARAGQARPRRPEPAPAPLARARAGGDARRARSSSDAFLVKCNAEEARLLTGEDDPRGRGRGPARRRRAARRRHARRRGRGVRGGGLKLDVPGVERRTRSARSAPATSFMGAVLAGLAGDATSTRPRSPPPCSDAVVEGARATERWGALGVSRVARIRARACARSTASRRCRRTARRSTSSSSPSSRSRPTTATATSPTCGCATLPRLVGGGARRAGRGGRGGDPPGRHLEGRSRVRIQAILEAIGDPLIARPPRGASRSPTRRRS